MQSHYAVTTTIRYYKPPCDVTLLPGSRARLRVALVGTSGEAAFDVSRWKDAPHVALANLSDDPKAVAQFIRVYGLPMRDKRKTVSVREVLDHRDFLRRAWEGDTFNFFALAAAKDVSLIAQPTEMHLAISALWPLIQILFARDWAEKRIRKCANPDCKEVPYFCAVRQGQNFCSHRCAVLINVRQFRAREADLKAKGEGYAKAKKA